MIGRSEAGFPALARLPQLHAAGVVPAAFSCFWGETLVTIAFLKKDEDTWTRTNKIDDIIDHTGDMLMCETEEEIPGLVDEITLREGRFARRNHWWVRLFDEPIYSYASGMQRAKAGESVLVDVVAAYWESVKVKGRSFCVPIVPRYYESYERVVADCEKNNGFIYELEDDEYEKLYRLSYNPELCAEGQRRIVAARRRADRNRAVSKHGMSQIANKLCENMGRGYARSFRIEHFLTYVLAHDGYCGRRETNKVVRTFAEKWNKDPEGWEKHFSRWAALPVMKKLSERMFSASTKGRKGRKKNA